MTKKSNSALIIWAVVALVVGIFLGLLITNLTTTGNAKSALSEKRFRNANTYLFGELILNQWFDNVDDDQEKDYYFYQLELAVSDTPSIFAKDSQYSLSTSTVTYGNMVDELPLQLTDYGQYSTDEGSYIILPFTQNNLTVYSSMDGYFTFEDGQEISQHKEFVANPNGGTFAEVIEMDFGCNGQYQMVHTDVGNISEVHFYLNIRTPNGSNDFDWESPTLSTVYTGYFPPEAIAILTNGLDNSVYLNASIVTATGQRTVTSTGKTINCQTGKSTGFSSEQLEELKEKTGNTPKQIAEKFASEQIKK